MSHSLRPRVWRWMRFGGNRGGTRGWAAYEPLSKPRLLEVPRQIWRVLRRYSARPAPIHYIALAGVGAILGVVLRIARGVPWWIPPVFAIAGGWALSLVPVGLRGSGVRLDTELLTAINPEKGLERRRREEQQRIRASELALYEVADWPGTARLAGWGTSSGKPSHVTLSFADDDDALPTVWATTFDAVHVTEQAVRFALVGELAGMAADLDVADATPASIRNAHLSAASRLRRSSWDATSMRIDGEDYEACAIGSKHGHASYARLGRFWIATVITGSAGLSLRAVSDDSAYWERPRAAS